MAVGKAGEPADRDKLEISLRRHPPSPTEGERDPAYNEAATSAYMKNEEIDIRVAARLAGTATVYTCDLTHGYITINGDYRS